MRSIRLRNVRSLADTGEINIRPITLFVGMNSSGKSTLLRSFPLIMQSIRTRSNAPILWYGDYVDFGSVEEVKSSFAGEENVHIEIDLGNVTLPGSRSSYYGGNRGVDVSRLVLDIELEDVEGKTRLKSFSLEVERDKVEVEIGSRGAISSILVNSHQYNNLFPSEKYRVRTTDFVPQITLTGLPVSHAVYRRKSFDAVEAEIVQFFKAKVHGRVLDETITTIAAKLFYEPRQAFPNQLRRPVSDAKSWQKFVEDITGVDSTAELDKLHRLYLLSALPDILMHVERVVSARFSSVSYVGPSRATGERYYRMQELAVDQIDPQGKNLAMFLNSLSASQQTAFSSWLTAAIGYGINIERQTGHIQLQLKEEHSEKSHNLADMGYGFSQVLPIMAQIWSRQFRRVAQGVSPFVVMEQPELHLHPAYQAKIADVFANAIARDPATDAPLNGLKFIIETHSEAIVNRLGDLIFEGRIRAEDVAVYIFDKNSEDDRKTVIKSSVFKEDGSLENWPVGFFSSRAA